MYLVFDTETSGFVSDKLDINDNEQCHLMQIGMLLLDAQFNEKASFKSMIQVPERIKVNPGAFAAHGLTVEDCIKYGVHINTALIVFAALASQAEKVVCHNFAFDNKVIQQEFQRNNATVILPPSLCTMQLTTDACMLPGKIKGKYKWPKLQEALQILLNEKLVGAHDAMADVRGTAKLLKWIITGNVRAAEPSHV